VQKAEKNETAQILPERIGVEILNQ